MYAPTNFREALEMDMERRSMTEAVLGRLLDEDKPLSQQAIHKWKQRGFPPLARLDQLKKVLGDDSYVAKLTHQQIYANEARTVVRPSASKTLDPVTVDREWVSQESKTLRNMLTASDEQNSHTSLERDLEVKNARLKLDWASDKFVVEMIYVTNGVAHKNVSSALLRLLAVSRTYGLEPVLMLIERDGSTRLPAHALAAISAFNIVVKPVRDGAEAAWALKLMAGDNTLIEPDD